MGKQPGKSTSAPADKAALLNRIGARYVTAERQPNDIDVYEAAACWGITPKAAEWRLTAEVNAGRGQWLYVRSTANRILKVYREHQA